MAYKNKDKERKATRLRVQRYRQRQKQGIAVTSNEITRRAIRAVTPEPQSRLVWIQGRLVRILI